jgi:gluconolactonase
MRIFRESAVLLVVVFMMFVFGTIAQAQKKSLVVTANDPVGEPKILAEGFDFPEGPSLDKDGNVFLVNVSSNLIHKVTPSGEVTVIKDVGSLNLGSIMDREGNLYIANYGSHKILKLDLKNMELSMAAERTTDGETLRGPNDFAWDRAGRLYFTDSQGSATTPIGNVCYIDLDGKCKKFTTGFCYPNGIVFSKDFKSLYIGETNSEVIWRFEVNDDGTAGMKHFFYYMGEGNLADGIKIDTEGHLWIASWSTSELWRISPEGKLVYKIKIPGKGHPTNICFGGPDMRTAYVTYFDQGGKLFTVRMPVAGMPKVPEGMGRR